jgi:hypothetical protein
VLPERRALYQLRRAWVFELETLLHGQRWAKTDAASLQQMICEMAGALLDSDDGAAPDGATVEMQAAAEAAENELKSLYNRHSETDYDSEGQEQLQDMKAMLEKMGGVDLGEEPVESIEELMRRAHAQMHAKAEGAQEPDVEPPAARRREKPKRKTAAQKRAEEDAQRISQTVREVYRKLASALHPDRLPAGASAAERDERTTLMQRANAAYEAGDLLKLLELQLQIEQVDLAHATNIAADQVRHFNKLLNEQLRELEVEIDSRQHAFCASFGLMVDRRLDPGKLVELIKDELRELNYAQHRITHDRRTLRGDPASARRFLKQWRREQQLNGFGELFF